MRKLTKNTFGLDTTNESRRIFRQNLEQKILQENPSDSDCFSSEDFDENVAYVTKEVKLIVDEQNELEYASRYNLADRKSSKASINKDLQYDGLEEFSQKETERFNAKDEHKHFETEIHSDFCNTLKLNLDKLDQNLMYANLTVPDEYENDNNTIENIKTVNR